MPRPSKGNRQQISLRLPPDIVTKIDTDRGSQGRDDWAAIAFDFYFRYKAQILGRGTSVYNEHLPEGGTHPHQMPVQKAFDQ